MRLFGNKNSKIKADPPKIRIEKVPVNRPSAKLKPKPKPAGASAASSTTPARTSTATSNRLSPKKAVAAAAAARQKSRSPYASSAEDSRADRKRKALTRLSSTTTPRRSPAAADHRIEFDDSDGDEGEGQDDDSWMNLESANKRRRKSPDDAAVLNSTRKLRSSRAFQGRVKGLSYIHAVDVASLELKCVPVMGAQREDVAIELQYPSTQAREK